MNIKELSIAKRNRKKNTNRRLYKNWTNTVSYSYGYGYSRSCEDIIILGEYYPGEPPTPKIIGTEIRNLITIHRKPWKILPILLEKYKPTATGFYSNMHPYCRQYQGVYKMHIYAFYDAPLDAPMLNYNKSITPNTYIHDSHYRGMMIRKKLKSNKHILALQYEYPSNMTDPLIRCIKFTSNAPCQLDTYVSHADIKTNYRKNCWSPITSTNYQDSLIITLDGLYVISGLGTKGRAQLIYKNGLVSSKNTPEWVNKYKLFYRTSNKTDWLLVGNFTGNTDENTEVAHKIVSPDGNSQLIVSQLRIQPTGYRCYHGHKSMRVAVYGKHVDTNEDNKDKPDNISSDIYNANYSGTTLIINYHLNTDSLSPINSRGYHDRPQKAEAKKKNKQQKQDLLILTSD